MARNRKFLRTGAWSRRKCGKLKLKVPDGLSQLSGTIGFTFLRQSQRMDTNRKTLLAAFVTHEAWACPARKSQPLKSSGSWFASTWSPEKQLWSTTIAKAKPEFDIHPSNSFATETPAANEKGVYAYFGAAGVVAGLSHDGKLNWKRDVGVFKTNNNFGTGSSLAIDNDKLFVQLLSEESSEVLCLSTSNGETKWRKKRADENSTSWSTPVVWKNKVRKELVVSGGNQVDSFHPDTGDLIWSVRKVKAATACSICVDENRIYFGGSDPMSKGPLFAVEPGGEGKIEPKITNQKFDTCTWRVPRAGPGMSSPVSNGQYVVVADRSVAICYNSKDGSVAFKNRLPSFSMVVACPTVVGNEVVMIDEKGKVGAVAIGDEFRFRKLGQLNDVVWSSPAVAGNRLLVRGIEKLYCFRLNPEK